jgi:hypothetical protein
MEFDSKTILYIVFALAYFAFTNFIKKKKGTQNQPPSDRPEDATETLGPPPGRRPTFEELLEEFTTGKPAQTEAPIELAPVKQEVEVSAPSSDFVKKQKALEAKAHSTIQPDIERFGRFDEVPETTSVYSDLLKEPDGARKAFVLSEIFKKKF